MNEHDTSKRRNARASLWQGQFRALLLTNHIEMFTTQESDPWSRTDQFYERKKKQKKKQESLQGSLPFNLVLIIVMVWLMKRWQHRSMAMSRKRFVFSALFVADFRFVFLAVGQALCLHARGEISATVLALIPPPPVLYRELSIRVVFRKTGLLQSCYLLVVFIHQ